MKRECKYCGKECRINPSDCENLEDYHCKECRPKFLEEQRQKGIKPEFDWSHIKKLNAMAMAHGHQSIFGRRTQ